VMTDHFYFLKLAGSLGWQDVKQSYRRSALGPFWLTLGMAVQVGTLGAVFGLIFATPLNEFLPFIGASLILWNFISNSILDGSMGFVSGEAILRQLPVPHYVHILRALWKNVLMLAHNIVILPILFIFYPKGYTWNLLLVIPGFILVAVFLFVGTYILALATTRFRDMQQIISSVMSVVFYVTPVIWQPALIPSGTAHLLLGLNPFYHFLQIIRLPILGQAPTLENWVLSSSMSLLALFASVYLASKFKNRLVYWV
jgi:ABC-type polysaccharide/polyol phosphate export permease